MQLILNVWSGNAVLTERDATDAVVRTLTPNADPVTIAVGHHVLIHGDGTPFRVLVQNTDASGSGRIHAQCERSNCYLHPAAENVLGSSVVLESVADARVDPP